LTADLAEGVDHGAGGGSVLAAPDRRLDAARRRVAAERHGGDLVGVDEDVEALRETGCAPTSSP
jgi:hypothetical protein